jgi:hypothetical protein
VLVSEVMSQQTQIDRVVPKFQLFIHTFPSPRECAGAPLSDLLTIWQGLGYPRRCRNLHEAAKVMVRDHDAQVPADLEQLLALPGIGEYTARAVLAFAEHVDVGVVDTNVTRVFARVMNKPLGKQLQTRLFRLVCRGNGTRCSWISGRRVVPPVLHIANDAQLLNRAVGGFMVVTTRHQHRQERVSLRRVSKVQIDRLGVGS